MICTRKTIAFFIFFVLQLTFSNHVLAKIEIVLGDVPLNINPNLPLKAPSTSDDEIIISREQYIISYNKFRRSPNWVAWKLESDNIGNSGRSNNFLQDYELENYLSRFPRIPHAVGPREYQGSCFDRGHQVPSGDRTDTIENNQPTFFMSNMIPQTAYLNRGMWQSLEQYTRDLVQKQGKKAYIIAGPIYDQDFGRIGPNGDIPVPSKDFKIIIILNSNQKIDDIDANTPIISVVMPNVLQNGTKPPTRMNQACTQFLYDRPVEQNEWMKYRTSVSEVERLSGLKIVSLK